MPQMQQQQQDDEPFWVKAERMGWLARFPALTVMVYLRRSIGVRIVSPLSAIVILFLVGGVSTDVTPDARPFDLIGFLLLAIFLAVCQWSARMRDFRRGVARHHSEYVGTSIFNWPWLPLFFRRDRRIERFVDPAVCMILGYYALPYTRMLGLWLVFCGLCLRAYEFVIYKRELKQHLDLIDGVIQAENQSRRLEPFIQSPSRASSTQQPSKGVPTGLGSDIEQQINRNKNQSFPPNPAKPMNNPNHVPGVVATNVNKLIESLPPLKNRKHPGIAAVAGAFGAVGIGLYFQTWLDFLLSFGLCLLFLAFTPPTAGLAAILGSIFCAAYSYRRAKSSNAKLEQMHTSATVLDAEVVASTPPIISRRPQPPAAKDLVEVRLQRAAELRDSNAITPAEYDAKRAEILSEL